MLGSPDLVGIDIGQYAIKIARIKKSGKTFMCNFIAYEIIPSEIRDNRNKEALKDLVTNLLKFNKITKGQPVVHVAFGDAIMRSMNISQEVPKDGLEGAIELDLSSSLPFPIDQVYFDFDEKPSKDGTYLAIASRRDIVDAKTDLFANRAKTLLEPEVDIDVFAFERLIGELLNTGEVENGSIGIIDIGYVRSRIFIFQNGEYIFAREAQIGGNQVNEIIRDVYDVDLEDAEIRKLNQNFNSEYEDLVLTPYANSLGEQINLAIDFYEASATDAIPLKKLYLTGGGSQLRGLTDKLKHTVSMPLDHLYLSKHIKLQSGQSEIFQSGLNHGLVIGLAMEGK